MTLANRREFFRTAAAGAVGAAGMLGGVAAAEARSPKSAKYDLIIVGAGCGGLVCAVHAAELGLKPLLLEKMPMPAGNTIYAAGFLLGPTLRSRRPRERQTIRTKPSSTT